MSRRVKTELNSNLATFIDTFSFNEHTESRREKYKQKYQKTPYEKLQKIKLYMADTY